MAKSDKRDYHPSTRFIHGRMHSEHWQYNDHIVPPISSSAAYRLESSARGAEGFIEFANPEFNTSQLQAVHQRRVRHGMLTRCSVDAHDPQPSEVALLGSAIAIGIRQRFLDLLARDSVELRLGQVIALGPP